MNIFEFLWKDGNIAPEKARKSRQMQFHDKTAYVWMGILPLKKRINRDKCSFATKQHMFGVFAIDEILRYRGSPFPASRTLCHPVLNIYCRWFWKKGFTHLELWITCSKSFVSNIKTIIPQIIYYLLRLVTCFLLRIVPRWRALWSAGKQCGKIQLVGKGESARGYRKLFLD